MNEETRAFAWGVVFGVCIVVVLLSAIIGRYRSSASDNPKPAPNSPPLISQTRPLIRDRWTETLCDSCGRVIEHGNIAFVNKFKNELTCRQCAEK